MSTIRNRLHPFRDISEHNMISLYSLDQTGLAGQVVKIATGSANPQSTQTDAYISTPVGVTYNGTSSTRYETIWKVSPTASGDTRNAAIGITLLSTLEYDENGFPLKFFPERCKQIGAVISGETVTLATAGIIGVWGQYLDSSLGPIQPGSLAVISRSGNGVIASVAPGNATNFRAISNTGGATVAATPFIYDQTQVIGKFLSSLPTSPNTGIASEFAAQGGYAFINFNVGY